MLLVIDIQGNIVVFLWASLVLLVLFIAYKMLVKRMKQGQLEKNETYFVSISNVIVSNEAQSYEYFIRLQ